MRSVESQTYEKIFSMASSVKCLVIFSGLSVFSRCPEFHIYMTCVMYHDSSACSYPFFKCPGNNLPITFNG